MKGHRNIMIGAALAIMAASDVLAGAVVYKEAAAPWSAEQAVKMPPALTPDVLKAFEREYGAAAAAELGVKKVKVSALIKRFRSCDLTAEDARTAEKYLERGFRSEVRYFASGGCSGLKKAAAAAAAGGGSASLSGLEKLLADGGLRTPADGARFFDGSRGKGGGVPVRAAGGAGRAAGSGASSVRLMPAHSPKPLSSHVPQLGVRPRTAAIKAARPADLGDDGKVHQARVFWAAMRKESQAALKKSGLSPAEKAGALARLAASSGLGGLLYISNLCRVETTAARLGWDAGQGADTRVLAADSAKLAFYSAIFMLALLPIPLTKVAAAARAGKPWAVAMLGTMAAGPIEHYIIPFSD